MTQSGIKIRHLFNQVRVRYPARRAQKKYVFIRLNAAAFVYCLELPMRLLFEGSAYFKIINNY